MPVTQLGNDTTTVLADGPDFVMERVFDARASSSGRRSPNQSGSLTGGDRGTSR